MEKREDVWRSVLQEQFEHYEADTERDLWPAIEERIDARKVPFYLWRSTWLVAASVILLMGLIWMLGQPTGIPAEQTMATQEEVDMPPTQSPAEQPDQQQPPVQLAEVDMLPTAPSPEVLERLQQQHNDDIASANAEENDTNDKPSSLPPNRVIRLAGPMQPLRPENLQDLDAARPRENQNLAVARPRNPRPRPAAPVENTVQGERQSLDLNNLTLGDAVTFASNELGKLVETPLEVYTEEVEGQEVRTYQLDLFNLRITRKTHKKSKS